MNLKKLLWWKSTPHDEREEALMRQAYERTFAFLNIAIIVAITFGYIAYIYSLDNTPHSIAAWINATPGTTLLLILLGIAQLVYLCALFYGSTIFWNEDMPSSSDEKMIRTSLLILVICIVLFTALQLIDAGKLYYPSYIGCAFAVSLIILPKKRIKKSSRS